MPFKKGQSGNPKGKPKGTKNKLRTNLVQEILDIAEQLKKDKKGLDECAKSNPKWFFENFLKGLLPKNIEIDLPDEIVIKTELVKKPKSSGK